MSARCGIGADGTAWRAVTPPRRIAVVGAGGRMGRLACAEVDAADDLDLLVGIGRGDDLEPAYAADVALEVSTPASVLANTQALLGAGVPTVVGASGLDDDGLETLAGAAADAACLVVPNFAVGAVLLMRLAEQVARHLPDVEITELHHERKVDAPSGTAAATARRIAAARSDVTVPGPADSPARGLQVDGVPVHSVRLPGLVASQEVVFGGVGQTLTLRHDTVDRTAFMPGVLLALRHVGELTGLHVGLDVLLLDAPS